MRNFNISRHKPLREVVYEDLKQRIVTGDIPPGTRMMEVQLAEDMGVSRTPIREAIRKLEKEKLVTIEPHRGAYASTISVDEMLGLLVVRAELEQLAAELAAKHVTPELIKELEDITEEYDKAVHTDDTDAIIEYDEKFHTCIVNATGNKTLISFCSMVQDKALRFRYLYYDDFSRYEHMPSEHRHIIDAIKTGDEEKAREAGYAHVTSLGDFVKNEAEKGFKLKK
jgi:DNA-binding GntR family transcriptional regulator